MILNNRKLLDTDYTLIKLNQDYREMIPIASADERDEIKKSLQKNGQKYPVTIDSKTFELVDGYTRYDLLKDLGMPIWYKTQEFEKKKDIINFILISNVHRRHLRPFDKVRLFRPLYDVEKQKAQERLKNISRHRISSDEKGKSLDRFSKKIGVSPSTAERAIVVLDRGTNEQIEAIKAGKESLTRMYNVIVKKKEIEPERRRRYKIIIKDYKGKKIDEFKRTLTDRDYNNMISYIRVL